MKHQLGNTGRILDRFFARAAKPSPEQMDLSKQHVLVRLRSERENASLEPIPVVDSVPSVRKPMRWFVTAVAVAAIVAAIGVTAAFRHREVDTRAMVASVDGTLYRVAAGDSRVAQVGEKINGGTLIRSDHGSALTLADGSLIEMRSKSELAIEAADDGVRIRLKSGGVIVTAAKQRTGHLYVQTKDVTVSVVGTVFFVNAEEEGSRVAVIQGEVHVQQGTTSKQLLPGEQIATNPRMESHPVSEEIAWSRSAEAHLALLQRSTVPAEPRQAFEEISIRPANPAGPGAGGVRGGGGGGGGARGGGPGGPQPCGGMIQLNPGRIAIANVTLYRLINLAYGKNCRASTEIDLIAGVPDWGRSQAFDIQATIPAGSTAYTPQQLNNGEAPNLQTMLQNMLADRFNFALHRDSKEAALYNLVFVRAGKIKLSEDQTPPVPPTPQAGPPPPPDPSAPRPRGWFLLGVVPTEGKVTIGAAAIPLSTLINVFQGQEAHLVIDKTGMKGLYDIPQQTLDVGPFDISPGAVSVWPEIMQQLGLKLEPARGQAEVLVIDRVEKPSEN